MLQKISSTVNVISSSLAIGFLFSGNAYGNQQLINTLNAEIDADNPALDYLIQDVCVDALDNPIPGDPTVCPKHRNIWIGEKVPYLLTDKDTANENATYQALSSYPVLGTDGALKIMVSKNMEGNFNSSFRYSFFKSRDAYDLIDTSGPYISIIRTSDPGCYDQKFALNSSQRTNGWILFAPGGSGKLLHQIMITRLDLNPPPSCIAANTVNKVYQPVSQVKKNSVQDIWNAPTAVSFESGKRLQSIVTYHVANDDFTRRNNAIERFFFTREYGFTRWEAWIPLSRCISENGANSPVCKPDSPQNFLKGRCGVSSPIPGIEVWGNQQWVRVDCRDSTNYVALSKPMIPLTFRMARTNNLLDVDYHSVIAAQPLRWWSSKGAGKYPVVGNANWEILANGKYSTLTYQPDVQPLPSGTQNGVFTLKTNNNNANNKLLVDIDVFSNYPSMFFGTNTILGQ
ncbi:hypothetical protein NIES4074_00300 [Cylindrospermum sp. NIES-4074]|nr:hypothetical protein NIES4074_00300 [Cylindrospermum sp. NIES-4074]